MKLVLIADTHKAHTSLDLPEGDILIHAGDCLGWGDTMELYAFAYWLKQQSHKFQHILLVAGNHDGAFQYQPAEALSIVEQVPNLIYLQDSGVTLCGVRFWGSPWTTEFRNWYFMRRPGPHIDKAWKLIPEDTQVLITHSPPYGVLDKGVGQTTVGCDMLAYRLGPDGNLKPRLHVFGHSHICYGQEEHNGILHVNADLCDNRNVLVKPPVVLELSFD